jgi:hypothetical protein
MQSLTFAGHYLRNVFGHAWVILLLLAAFVGQFESIFGVKLSIPRWIRVGAIIAVIFFAQARVYWELAENPPLLLRIAPPPAPTIVYTLEPTQAKPGRTSQQQTGKNNVQTGQIEQGPCSNLQVGGSKNQQTGGNCAPIDRRLSSDQKTALIACLKTNPGKFTVGALGGNREALTFAQDWSEVLSAAGWKNEQPIPVASFMMGAGVFPPLRYAVRGTFDDASKNVFMLDGSPEKRASQCLMKLPNSSGAIMPYSDMPTGSIRIDVSDR